MKLSRRKFLASSSAAVVTATALPSIPEGAAAEGAGQSPEAAVPRTSISFRLNGRAVKLEVEDRWTLAELLRDHLNLTGTKIGCDRGECGTCTVLLDDQPIYSCSYLAVWTDGRRIDTVESLAASGTLHQLQKSFIEGDAPQCGFCTSGQLMAARALLDHDPRPGPAAVRQALSGTLCRCSNYNRYAEAVVDAHRFGGLPDRRIVMTAFGQPTPRIDAEQRVTGTARYTADVRLPGLLSARVLRSPHPHARILRIDTTRALSLPGVKAIITHENCRIVWGSGDTRNKRYLFNNPVRFVGDPVAAVAAVDRHVAEEALQLIEITYERLPFVLDCERALADGAVPIHPGGNLSPTGNQERVPEIYRRGDLAEGFRSSDRVFEDRYTSPHINNAQMEPRVSVATWEGEKLTVYASTQGISNCRDDLATDLGLKPEQVRVICEYMGGGFGNKNQCHDFDLMAAVLAKAAAAPVRLEFTRKEDFIGVHGRWPTRQYYKVGVAADGTLRAIQMRGYSGMGGYRKGSGAIAGVELYRCPNVETTVHPVYTNTVVAANFRAPAYPQGVFGLDSMMDHIAHELRMDPLEFRLKNITREYHDELPYTSYGLEDCIRQGAERFGWKRRWRAPQEGSAPVRRGIGMSIGSFHARVGSSSAIIRLDSSGRYAVHVAVTDVGAGAKTTMALIAAEALKVPLDRVRVISGDTDLCPYSIGESGSRTTNFTGFAVIEAARDLRRQIEARGFPQGDDILVGAATPQPRIVGKARYSFAAHFVEVGVDVELGEIRVLEYLAVHDSGRIVNPLTATSQVKGGVTQGIGMALHEQLLYDTGSGVPLNTGYYGARVPTHLDAPVVDVMFVETDDGLGPFGAKPIGEPPIIPSVAAIGNAFFNATGRRLKELPFSRDRVLEVLS